MTHTSPSKRFTYHTPGSVGGDGFVLARTEYRQSSHNGIDYEWTAIYEHYLGEHGYWVTYYKAAVFHTPFEAICAMIGDSRRYD